jgi:hypothetical protein
MLTDYVNRAISSEGFSIHKKVLWLNVAKDNVLGMHIFQPSNQLDSRHADGFQRELPAAHVKQVLQAWTEKLHDQRIVFAASTEIMDLRNTNCNK